MKETRMMERDDEDEDDKFHLLFLLILLRWDNLVKMFPSKHQSDKVDNLLGIIMFSIYFIFLPEQKSSELFRRWCVTMLELEYDSDE